MAKDNILKGGEFLIKETKAADVFIPEDFSEEQVMIAQTCNDFLESFVYPNLDRIDNQEEGADEAPASKVRRVRAVSNLYPFGIRRF